MKLAIIGGGMVGQCYGQAFAASGLTISDIWDMKPSEALRTFAQLHEIKIRDAAGPWLEEADLVVSAVFGSAALEVATAAIGNMRPGTVYVDMTTADPEHMVRAEAVARAVGVDFVDVAITGAVDMNRAKTPLLCSGARAEEIAAIYRRFESPIQVVGEKPGEATSLKLLRSVFTKGFEALTIECLITAERRGIRSQLHEILSDMDRVPLKNLMESIVRTHIEHAGRRCSEIVEAQRQVRMAGIQPLVLPGAQQVFERSIQHKTINPYQGRTVEEALQWLIGAGELATQPA